MLLFLKCWAIFPLEIISKEATAWAWEFLTEKLGLDEKDLWVSIYHEDDEAFEVWNKGVGVPAEKIIRLGKEDNFWELEVGPSGPCSEIYVDRGKKYGCGSQTVSLAVTAIGFRSMEFSFYSV